MLFSILDSETMMRDAPLAQNDMMAGDETVGAVERRLASSFLSFLPAFFSPTGKGTAQKSVRCEVSVRE
jgi:hypothetical protein